MNSKAGPITKVEFDVDTLVISDPCYVDKNDDVDGEELDRQMGDNLLQVIPDSAGHWIGEVEIENAHEWGHRVSVLRLQRMSNGRGEIGYHPKASRELGLVGVDSGQMWAGAITDLPIDYEALLDAYKDGEGNWQDLNCLEFGGGIVSSTGYGDGVYGVYAGYDRDNQVATIEVRFMEDVEEEGR